MNAFSSITSQALENRKTLSLIALTIVWLGGSFAVGASIFKYLFFGTFPLTTFVIALIVLAVSVPVYREKEQIVYELAKRERK